MGMDFVALFEYPGPTPAVLHAIDRLEIGKSCAAFRKVVERWRDDSFSPLRPESAQWQSAASGERVDLRPNLPNLEFVLRTAEHFYVSFGRDAVCAYHPLRWHTFLTVRHWESTMLNAVAMLCKWLSAGECIITSDHSAAFRRFHEELQFAEILEAAFKDDGEVGSSADLYQEQVDHDRAFRPGAEIDEKWPSGIPLPPGWRQSGTWDSKGIWRFSWRQRVEAYGL